jgi:hypothetical protein
MASNLFNLLSPLVNVLPEKYRIFALFIYKHKKLPNIISPETFNEKIQWRKINDRNPIFCKLADKVAVKDYIASLNLDVVIPKIIWQSDSLSDFNFNILTEKFVLKANHASGTNLIIRPGDMIDLQKLKLLEKEWRSIAIDETFVEWGYSQIPIKFFAEEFLDFDSFVPVDYKFWVFHGRVEFVQVDSDRYQGHKRAFYDRNWNKLPFLLTFPDVVNEIIQPKNLIRMIEIAEAIAGDLDFVRVDLYSDHLSVYFGEVTMYPDSGYGVFSPVGADLNIGKLWKHKL